AGFYRFARDPAAGPLAAVCRYVAGRFPGRWCRAVGQTAPVMTFERIAVIGAGGWGTALANVIARAGRTVTLAARDEIGAATLARRRESPRLPGHGLDPRVTITCVTALERNDAILLAVPSQHLRSAAAALAP